MDYCSKLVIAIALAFPSASFAGYAQASPPVDWSQNAGKFFYKAAANDVSFNNGVRSASSAVLNVGGRSVTMPVAYRFAANAGRVAASSAFGNPALFAALTVASVGYEAYKWYTDNDYEVKDGVWKQKKEHDVLVWTYTINNLSATVASTALGSCTAWAGTLTAFRHEVYTSSETLCVLKYYDKVTGTYYGQRPSDSLTKQQTTGKETYYDVLTRQQFEDGMASEPVPVGVPQHFPVPDVQWPVELPILNPTPEPVPKPSPLPVPTPQPIRVPQGEPQPIPNTDPAQWKTPVIDIVPSPTAVEPWRVDVQPKDIIKTDPTPLPSTAPVPLTPASGTTSTPATPDLCEKNPEILACQKVDLKDLEPSVLVSASKQLSIAKNAGWGPENGACPAPKTASIMGVNLSMPFTMLCDFAAGIRPLLIAFAWLSATLTFIGLSRKD